MRTSFTLFSCRLLNARVVSDRLIANMNEVARDALLDRIQSELLQVTNNVEEFNSLIGSDHQQQRRLRDCLTHLCLLHESPDSIRLKNAIRDLLSGMSSAEQFQNTAYEGREVEINGRNDTDVGVALYSTTSSGSAGRPKICIEREQLQFLISNGYTGVQIAEKYQVSSSYIYKSLKAEGLQPRNRFSNLTSQELNEAVFSLKKDFPKAGYRVMQGLLHSQGLHIQRDRVRDALRTVDPEGTAERWAQTIHRRIYKVAASNSLWHIDANLKLGRFGMVVHGAMDGSSHMVPYLKCLNNIKASSVFDLFVRATDVYGIPSRVRSDHGLENVDVAMFMSMVRGCSRSSHITGSSVHNQRIERFWRDVHHLVLKPFKEEFIELQEGGLLDVDNGRHLQALHTVFMAEVNIRLESFRNGWNCHKMSTDPQQRTPNQQWIDGMLEHADSNLTAVNDVFEGRTLQTTLENLPYAPVDNPDNIGEDEHQEYNVIQPLTREQIIFLERETGGITDLKRKYVRVVQILALGY